MDRKSERDIDLLFFEYKSYYDENDNYIVRWKIDWLYLLLAIFVVASMFTTFTAG